MIIITVGFFSNIAWAHQGELGVVLEPSYVMLPAVSNNSAESSLSHSPAIGASLEYSVFNDVIVLLRGFYAFGITSNLIGQTTFSDRTGNYYFKQSAGAALAGIRLESRSWFLPVKLGIGVQAGALVLVQGDRALKNDQGIKYKIDLPDTIQPLPLIAVSLSASGRIWHQIRLGVEPNLYIIPGSTTYFGFGLNLNLGFLFFM